VNDQHPRSGWFGAAAIQLGGLYLLVGALAKLIYGTPLDLPPLILEYGLPNPAQTFQSVVSLELVVALFAILMPRFAWPLLSLVLATFLAVLVSQVIAGAESCGCFGTSIQVAPSTMLAVDGGLLALILICKPWRAFRGRVPSAFARKAVLPALLLGVAAPWVVFALIAPEESSDSANARFVTLLPHEWVDKQLSETPLADHLDLAELPDDGLFIFYRNSCDACARHLAELAEENDPMAFYTLIRIPEEGEENRESKIRKKPIALVDTTLPEGILWVMSTPTEMLVEQGVVKSSRAVK
jgi:hypothetical protein